MAARTKTNTGQSTATSDVVDDSQDNTQSNPANAGASSGAGGVVDSAKQAASQAKEAASQVMDQAKDQATSRVDQGRQTLASSLQSVAHAFQSMGERLRHQEQGPVGQYAAEMGQAMGGQVERLASYLQGRDIHQLVTDVEGFARRSPATFLGGAFVLGLAASRFLKSSRPAPTAPENITDPSHLLPPASTQGTGTGPNQPYGNEATVPTSLATTSSASSPSTEPATSSSSSGPGTSGDRSSPALGGDLNPASGI